MCSCITFKTYSIHMMSPQKPMPKKNHNCKVAEFYANDHKSGNYQDLIKLHAQSKESADRIGISPNIGSKKSAHWHEDDTTLNSVSQLNGQCSKKTWKLQLSKRARKQWDGASCKTLRSQIWSSDPKLRDVRHRHEDFPETDDPNERLSVHLKVIKS